MEMLLIEAIAVIDKYFFDRLLLNRRLKSLGDFDSIVMNFKGNLVMDCSLM